MKWSAEEARNLGLEVLDPCAFPQDYPRCWKMQGVEVVINLDRGCIEANFNSEDDLVEAMNLPRFKTLKEQLIWLKLRT